jgi:zinc protease
VINPNLLSRLGAIALAVSLAGVPASAETAPQRLSGWGVALTDVIPDPAIRYGRLPNGMRYAIMRNAIPQGAASVRLRFEFGSLGEANGERGLAHFIEHMAFNGSTNVAEGEMVRILERQGLKFGPDTNAMTGFDQTTYILDLPKTDGEHLDTAMFLLKEVASEVKFDPAAVDRERGVVLGERRVRDTYQLRQAMDVMNFQVPGTPYPQRLPIGTPEVLKTATAATLKSLYQRYYRPENATLVFVGDTDPTAIEERIRKTFSSWTGAGTAGVPLPRGAVDFERPASFDTFVDPAIPTGVSLTIFRPWEDPADTLANRRRETVRSLAIGMFNRRMARLVNAPNSVLFSAAMSEDSVKEAALYSTLGLSAKDGAWTEALAIAEQELRKALQHGFTQQELDLQRTDSLGRLKAAAAQAEARTSSALANAILSTVGTPDFVTTPAFRAQFFERIAPSITVEEVNAELRRIWSGSAPLVHLSAKEPVEAMQVAAVFDTSRKIAVAAPKEEAAVAFGYDRFGEPGAVADDRRIADLGVRTLRFANNVRLNIKKTDFEKGKVSFIVRMAGGGLAMPQDRPGLATMLSALSALSATGKNSLEELKVVTAGHVVTPGMVVAGDAFAASGTTTSQDLPLQMKLSAAYFTDPGYRAEAAAMWQNLVPVFEKTLKATPGSVAQSRLPTVLAGNDLRFGLPPGDVLLKRTLDEARPLLDPLVRSAPIEVTVVGDVDEEAAIAAVAESFGALPARAEAAPAYADARKASFRRERSPIALTHSGGEDQTLVGAAWPTDDDSDYRKVLGMGMLREVMSLVLTERVREELGASYGVGVVSDMSSIYDGFGYMMVQSVVAPDKADEVDAVIAEVAAQLRNAPVGDDLIARARQPMLEGVAKSLRQNSYWLSVLDEAQSRPERLDRIRQREAIIRGLTAADLQALARQYLTHEQLQRIRISSEKLAPSANVASARR